MQIRVKRCRACRALGVGPRAARLWPYEGYLYCAEDYKIILQWHEQRGHVTGGVERMLEFEHDVRRGLPVRRVMPLRWESYIMECAEFAAWALVVDDRRTFVHYFARAVWAWALREV